jgi:hypothetical protein
MEINFNTMRIILKKYVEQTWSRNGKRWLRHVIKLCPLHSQYLELILIK